jgi:hypothetical protein
MRLKNLFRATMILAALSGICGQKSGPFRAMPSGRGAGLDFSSVTQLFKAMEGHAIIVRVYQNPYVDSEKYVKVSVPFSEGKMQLPVIRKTYPMVSRLSYVYFQASDQKDRTVADALDGFIFILPYADHLLQLPEPSLGNIAAFNNKQQNPYWTFLDAHGAPMAGASVEIRIAHQFGNPNPSSSPSIYVGQVPLDEKGRLKRIFCFMEISEFIFTVRHPRYGIASVNNSHIPPDSQRSVYIVPLLPKGSPTAAQSIQGTVVDIDGRPVKGAYIRVTPIEQPTVQQPSIPSQSTNLTFKNDACALTDEKGWFAYEPSPSDDQSILSPPPAGRRYWIEIMPPKSLNLRQMGMQTPVLIKAGSRSTYTLAPMNAITSFHTFAFKYPDREITNPDEFDKIELTFTRDGQEWTKLAYADFKEGFRFPQGTLKAEIASEGSSKRRFPEIEIGADSPKHLVFQSPAPIICRGKVIDESTGKPMAGVYVSSGYLPPGNRNAWTDQQMRELQLRANQYAKDESLGYTLDESYNNQNRVFLTNADGFYETRFFPGQYHFYALARGYDLGSTGMLSLMQSSKAVGDSRILSLPQPDAKGIVELPTIKVLPSERGYFPRLLFEDENGQVIDRTELSSVNITIKTEGVESTIPFDSFLRKKVLIPAIYGANARWKDKYCDFEPVDLIKEKPEAVVFKLREIRSLRVTYAGQVVNSITGEPIWGAIVVRDRLAMTLMDGDASKFEPQEWAALKTLGPNPDPRNSAFAPFKTKYGKSLCGIDQLTCAVTDQEGRFHIIGEQKSESFNVMANGFLHVQRPPMPLGIIDNKDSGRIKPEKNDVVILPVIRMLPAATIRFHPVVLDTEQSTTAGISRVGGPKLWRAALQYRRVTAEPQSSQSAMVVSQNQRGMVGLQLIVAPEDAAKLYPDMPADSIAINNDGIAITTLQAWQPNIDQTAYIPAGVNLTLKVAPNDLPNSMLPAVIGPMKLNKGEVKNLGRIKPSKSL